MVALTGKEPDLFRSFNHATDDGSFERHVEASGRTEPDRPRQNKPDSDLHQENRGRSGHWPGHAHQAAEPGFASASWLRRIDCFTSFIWRSSQEDFEAPFVRSL